MIVKFEVVEGSGVLSATEVKTSSEGIAEVTLRLGDAPGKVRIQATVSGLSSKAEFTAEISLPPNTINGRLFSLPKDLNPKETTILSGFEETTPTEGGNFFVSPPEVHRLTMVLDKQGNPFMLALLPPSDPSPRVDSLTTAVTLVFFATHLYTAPPELWPEAISLIENIPEVQQLAEVLAERLETSTSVLVDPDMYVRSALEDAIRAVDAELARLAGAPKVTPPGPQSQVRLVHPAGG